MPRAFISSLSNASFIASQWNLSPVESNSLRSIGRRGGRNLFPDIKQGVAAVNYSNAHAASVFAGSGQFQGQFGKKR